MNNQKLTNEVVVLNLMNASRILNIKCFWNQPKSANVFKSIFESIIDYKPGVNFNESIVFKDENNFLNLMEADNSVDALLASPAVKEHIIPFSNNNVYAYLSKLNEMAKPGDGGLVKFFESDEKAPITIVLETIRQMLSDLNKSNEIEKFVNKTILNTRIAMGNVNVFGFNLFDAIKLQQLEEAKINGLLFNNNSNELLIITDQYVYSYNIKQDVLSEYLVNYYTAEPTRFPTKDIKSFDQLFTELKKVLNSDFSILYINNDLYATKDKSNFNNLYNDQKFTKSLKESKEKLLKTDPDNLQRQTIRKTGVVRGYLVK